MKKLLVYLKDYKKETFLGPLFKLLEASFELIVPLVVAAIIDVGIANGDKNYIVRMCGVMVLLGMVGLLSSVTAQFFAAKAATGFATKLRHALFAKIQSLSFTELDEVGTSTMITRMTSDINQLQSGVNMVLRLFLRSPFIVFGAMIMAFTIDVKAALVFVVVIPSLSLVVFGIMAVSIPKYKGVQAALDKVLSLTRENLEGVRVIRAFGRDQEERREFEQRNNAFTQKQLLVGKISAFMNPVTYSMINVGIIVLIYVGALRVNSGAISQGEVVALYNYMSQILVELIKLANLIVTLTKALACGGRIENLLSLESYMKEKVQEKLTENPEYKVEFQQVSMRYKGAGGEALSDISFVVKPGQTVGIIGGTGSGKTSLVQFSLRGQVFSPNSKHSTGAKFPSVNLKIIPTVYSFGSFRSMYPP